MGRAQLQIYFITLKQKISNITTGLFRCSCGLELRVSKQYMILLICAQTARKANTVHMQGVCNLQQELNPKSVLQKLTRKLSHPTSRNDLEICAGNICDPLLIQLHSPTHTILHKTHLEACK